VLDILLGKPFEHALTRTLCLSDSTVKFAGMPKPFECERLDVAALHCTLQRTKRLGVGAVGRGWPVLIAFVFAF
jgi:hypothetical protein